MPDHTLAAPLAARIAEQFRLGRMLSCQPIPQGLMNSNWRMTTSTGHYARALFLPPMTGSTASTGPVDSSISERVVNGRHSYRTPMIVTAAAFRSHARLARRRVSPHRTT